MWRVEDDVKAATSCRKKLKEGEGLSVRTVGQTSRMLFFELFPLQHARTSPPQLQLRQTPAAAHCSSSCLTSHHTPFHALSSRCLICPYCYTFSHYQRALTYHSNAAKQSQSRN